MNFQQGQPPGAAPPPPAAALGGTSTTTTVTETHVQTNLRWDPAYVRTVPGILKLVCVVRQTTALQCGPLN